MVRVLVWENRVFLLCLKRWSCVIYQITIKKRYTLLFAIIYSYTSPPYVAYQQILVLVKYLDIYEYQVF